MEELVPLVIVGALGVLVVTLLVRTLEADEQRWLSRTLFLALGLRLGAATIFSLVPSTRFFHEDAGGYEWWGQHLASAWHGHGVAFDLAERLGQNYGYYYLAGAIYYLLPFAPAPAMVNGVLGTVTVFFVYRLARDFFQPVVARRAALLTAFMPSMILWSSITLKDPIVSLLILISLRACVQLKQKITPRAVLMLLLPVIALQPLRFYMLYFIGFSVVVSLGLERGLRSVTGVYKQLVVVGGALALIALIGATGRVSEGTAYLSLERVSTFRHGMATTAQSGFAESVDVSTPGGALLFLPIGVATLLLSPFPWQMLSLRALMAAPETIYWWLLIPSLFRGIRFVVRERWREASPLLIFAGTLTAAYSLVHGNVGSGFRQRAQIFVVFFIFAAVGVYQRRAQRAKIDEHELLVKTPA